MNQEKEYILDTVCMRKPLNDILNRYYDKKKALISFNIQNIDQLFYLNQTANEIRLPVLAQFSAKYIPYFDKVIGLSALVQFYKSDYLYFHLDHCLDRGVVKRCVNAGFDSVMFDGSSFPLNENIKLTNEIYAYSKKNNCLLEAELGAISGVEDGHGVEKGDLFSFEELERFHKNTDYDLLALAIGNAHGVYETTEGIRVDLLAKARDIIGNARFVLHGGTGMEEELIKESIDYGVVKINISTALKIISCDIVRENVNTSNGFYDHIKLHESFHKLKDFYKTNIVKFSL